MAITAKERSGLIVIGFVVTLVSSGISSFTTVQLHGNTTDQQMLERLVQCQTRLESHLEWHQNFKIPPEWFEEDVYDHIKDKNIHAR